MDELNQNNADLGANEVFREATDRMAYWSKLFGVMFYVLGAFMAIGGVAMVFIPSITPGMGLGTRVNILMAGFYILMAGLYFFPGKMLIGFSNSARKGLVNGDNNTIAEGFNSMGRVFRFWGVISIIGLGFYALGIAMLFLGTLV
jgi:hypothetical protein